MRAIVAGFGNVGRTLVEQLAAEQCALPFRVKVVGVSDVRFGTVINPKGIDTSLLIAAAESGTFEGFPGFLPDASVPDMLNSVEADVFVELTVTDLTSGQPALTYIKTAIDCGLDISTTNKGPIALYLQALESRATGKDVTLQFEGTVMSGTPVVSIARNTVRPARFVSATGILNGTTNFMLGRIEQGLGFDEALAEAQELGYAEADPSADINGGDSAAKLVILSQILTDHRVPISEVATTPLSAVLVDTVRRAHADGAVWKYVATLKVGAAGPELSVGPRLLPSTHALAAVGGATNAITFETELLGSVTVAGAGAGRTETVVAVLSDLAAIARRS